ncbi:MAG: RHS repeat-associated core domain-containing protein, partial [Peptococcia bacterium]
GKVTDRYQYSAYGEILSSSGNTDTPFLYNGRDGVMTDANGLYYMRARYYNPEIRRFVSQDILLGVVIDGQSLNRYAYVQGNPIGYVDPLGLARDGGKLRAGNSYLSVADFRLLQMNKSNLIQARSLPAKGKPNSTDRLYNPDGTLKQERWYGPDGRALRDRDYNHSGEDTHEFPHDHEWDWSKSPPRQKGVPVPQTEKPDKNNIQDSTFWGALGATAGVVFYIIISEGSRIVFPIRNLAPVI